MEAHVKHFPGMRVAYVTHYGPYEQCEPAWNKLMAWAAPKGLLGPDTIMLGVAHDDPRVTPAEKIRYDACISVGQDIEAEGEIEIGEVQPGEYAMCVLKGSYSKLPEVYGFLYDKWIPENGRAYAELPAFEIYINNPLNTPEDELITEIWVPLAQ